ncbi:hypothetical protein ACQ4LE_003107 [Meloidogyne hapla]
MPLSILLLVYHSYCKNSNTVILPNGFCVAYGFSGEHYERDNTITKLSKKVFTDSMEPFNRVKLTEEEYVLLRAIIYSNSFTTGLSKYGKELLLVESEKYSRILMKVLQNRYGQLPGARRYAECIHLIQTCFHYGYQSSLLFNYLANVHDHDRFYKVMPGALITLFCKKYLINNFN